MSETTMEWHRSSFCADSQCVEVAAIDDVIAVRDNKNLDRRPMAVSRTVWHEFLDGIEAGDFCFH